MRKNYVIVMLIISIALLTACVKEEQVNSSSNSDIMTIVEPEVQIKLTLGANTDDLYLYEDKHKNLIIDWQEYFFGNYNVSVDINYASPFYYGEYRSGEYIVEQIEDKGLEGLIMLTGEQVMGFKTLINEGSILPLNEYLKNNTYYNQMADVVSQPFEIQNNIYAIPAGNYYNPSVRLIRRDILEKTDSVTPTTLAELQEILKRAHEQDLGIPFTIGGVKNFADSVKDIFHANGCYPSYTGDSSLSLDPLTGSYEDFMLKAGAKDSFEYLKYLFENELAQVKEIKDLDDFVKSKELCGSYYGTIWDYTDTIQNEYESIWYLKGSNDKYLNAISPVSSMYVMSRNTENPQETVDTFINYFLEDSIGHICSFVGLENIQYTLSGNDIHRIIDENELKLVEHDVNKISGEYAYYQGNNELMYANTNLLNSITDQMIVKDLAFSSSLYPYTVVTLGSVGWGSAPGEVYTWIFDNFINKRGELNVQEMLDEYRKDVRCVGAQEILDSLNELYGTKATYGYSD